MESANRWRSFCCERCRKADLTEFDLTLAQHGDQLLIRGGEFPGV